MSKISLNELNNYYEDEGSQPSGSSSNKKRKMVKGNIKIEKKTNLALSNETTNSSCQPYLHPNKIQ